MNHHGVFQVWVSCARFFNIVVPEWLPELRGLFQRVRAILKFRSSICFYFPFAFPFPFLSSSYPRDVKLALTIVPTRSYSVKTSSKKPQHQAMLRICNKHSTTLPGPCSNTCISLTACKSD